MAKLGDNLQTADQKTEKHVPVIECPDQVKEGELFDVKVTMGKEITHPNTTEHHIRWITLYFHAHGEKFNYEVGILNLMPMVNQSTVLTKGPSTQIMKSLRH